MIRVPLLVTIAVCGASVGATWLAMRSPANTARAPERPFCVAQALAMRAAAHTLDETCHTTPGVCANEEATTVAAAYRAIRDRQEIGVYELCAPAVHDGCAPGDWSCVTAMVQAFVAAVRPDR